MTSREWLAAAVIGAPRRSSLALAAIAPRRAVSGVAADRRDRRRMRRARARRGRARRRRTGRSSATGSSSTPAGGLLVGVIGLVGHRQRARLARVPAGDDRPRSSARSRRPRTYYAVLFAFWAVLVAVPLAGNLGAAWLLVEATTAASALLVGFSGRPRALEAGWKYLILTSLGLGVALLGIVARRRAARRAAGSTRSRGGRSAASTGGRRPRSSPTCCCSPASPQRSAGRPCTTGFRTRTPRRRAPVSALLSAALLPAVLLVAWRCEQGARARGRPLDRAVGAGRVRSRLARRGGAVPLAARSPGSGCSPTRASSTWG